MAKETIQKENYSQEEKKGSFSITTETKEAFLLANYNLPERTTAIRPIDLVWAIVSSECKGKRMVVATATGRFFDFLDLVERRQKKPLVSENPVDLSVGSNVYLVESSVANLFLRAAEFAGQNPIGTDHLLLAETERERSILVEHLSAAGVKGSLREGIKDLAEIIEFREQVSAEIGSLESVSSFSERAEDGVPETRIRTSENVVRDYLADAKEGKYKDLYFRPELIRRLLYNLSSQDTAVIITEQLEEADSIMKGLALQLAEKQVDKNGLLKVDNIIAVDPAALVTNLEQSINLVAIAKKGIFYLSKFTKDLGQILTGEVQGGRILRNAIMRKQKLVLVMTPSQWKEWCRKDFFNEIQYPIFVESATIEDTIKLIKANKLRLEKELGCEISEEAIKTAATTADRFLKTEIPLPASAILLLKWAATEISIQSSKMTVLENKKVILDMKVDPDDVLFALEVMKGIETVPENKKRYLEMERMLGERIIGQDEVLRELASAIRRAKAGMKDPKKPIGSFIFMGPSGVGKTEVAKSLAEFLFGDEQALIEIDMSEYGEKHTVSRLIGAPPGYVGYQEGGQLTEPLRKKPYSVILFDELEKAHPEVLNIFLQMLQEGRLTDGQGNKIDLKNTVIIATGNVGSIFFSLGDDVSREEKVQAVLDEIKRTFRPELLNRFDGILIFNTLTMENMETIAKLQIKKLNKLLAEQNLSVEVSSEAVQYLAKKDYVPEYGARHLQRVIQGEINNPLSTAILSGEYKVGDTIKVDLLEEKIVFGKRNS